MGAVAYIREADDTGPTAAVMAWTDDENPNPEAGLVNLLVGGRQVTTVRDAALDALDLLGLAGEVEGSNPERAECYRKTARQITEHEAWRREHQEPTPAGQVRCAFSRG